MLKCLKNFINFPTKNSDCHHFLYINKIFATFKFNRLF
jgi:hypothetical protein